MSKLKGANADNLYYWADEWGWIHVSETEKLLDAYERFKKKHGKRFIVSSPRVKNGFFDRLYRGSLGKAIENG